MPLALNMSFHSVSSLGFYWGKKKEVIQFLYNYKILLFLQTSCFPLADIGRGNNLQLFISPCAVKKYEELLYNIID